MRLPLWFAVFCLTASTTIRADEAVVPEKHRQFFETYCTECHDADKQKGKLRLDNVSLKLDSVESAERWQKILNQVNSGEMPPEDSKQPEKGAKTEFLDSVANTLVVARKTLSDQHGNITMRRLNRREYKNTIRELLGVEVDVRDLPKDSGSGAFDTVGSALFMSSDQFEQYLTLGRKAIDEAYATHKPLMQQPVAKTDNTGPQDASAVVSLKKTERRETEVLATRQVRGLFTGYFAGGYKKAKAWMASDRSKPPKDFGLTDEDEVKFRILEYERYASSFAAYLANPLSDTGSLLVSKTIFPRESIALPPDAQSPGDKARPAVPPGNYLLRLRIGHLPDAPKERAFLEMGLYQKESGFSPLGAYHISGTTTAPQILEIPVKITSDGPHTFSFREKVDPNLVQELQDVSMRTTGFGPPPALWIDWVEWEGPLAEPTPPAIADLFATQTPNTPETQLARTQLEQFATRAFRGLTPEPSYLARLLDLFEARRKAGDSFRDALKEPISVVLSSPGFLYLSEPNSSPTRRPLTQREVATRLAYLIWSAPPDAELLTLSQKGDLSNPEILSKQVDRLIEDPRSSAFTSAFVQQWLGLERLDFFQFDTKVHRTFDDSTKAAARMEVIETFASLLQKRQSLSLLLKSDFVVINGLLAEYYGIPDVTGDTFRAVKLAPDSPRGGLLGMAAIQAMGSNGKETSPVERGAWVLRKLLHEPPPPAPPNVPQLSRLESKLLTTRERLMAHQEQPQCASCHRKIDPIGFGLENFDAAGKWRKEDGYEKKGVGKKKWPIEPAGAFHNGPAFKDYFELRDLIAAKPERIARGFTESLIEYGLGRGFGFSDEDLAVRILEQTQKKDFEVRAFLRALVNSPDFQMK
jgi:hypothetical protein